MFTNKKTHIFKCAICSISEPDLEEFLNTLYAQTGKPSADTASGGCDGSTYQRKKGKKRSKI